MTVVIHAAYLPDLVLCYFLLCPDLKLAVKGSKYNDITMFEA
jgi:hypothetical protein